LGVLCPDLTAQAKKALAEKVFELCPMLLFANQIAGELNEFFKGEE
jgi:hypothetical protein